MIGRTWHNLRPVKVFVFGVVGTEDLLLRRLALDVGLGGGALALGIVPKVFVRSTPNCDKKDNCQGGY